MSEQPNDGRYSAFPVTYDPTGVRMPSTTADGTPVLDDGMSIRQYAAIHLRVPMSDCAWLDQMIREAQRNELAAKALNGMCAAHAVNSVETGEVHICKDSYLDRIAHTAYSIADAMLAARNGGAR